MSVLSAWPPRPDRGGDEDAFDASVDAWHLHESITFRNEINAFADSINNFSTTTASSTSLTIAPGTQTLEVDVDKGFLKGMPIRLVSFDDPTNLMQGDLLDYDIDTGDFVVNVKHTEGSGTFHDWVIFSAGTLETRQQAVLTTGAQPAYEVATTLGNAFNLYEQLTIVAHASNSGNPTLERDGLAVKAIKQYDSTAGKIAGVVLAGMAFSLLYDGVDYIILNPVVDSVKVGMFVDLAGLDDEPGYLRCPTAATNISRAAYPKLWAAIHKESAVSISIATPGVIGWVANPLRDGLPVIFSTTGALPTGIVAGTTYYVVNKSTDAFQVSATRGGAAIGTGGSQSGVHTATCAPWGIGDGSTTFGMPWFPANYTTVQASGGNEAEQTVGENLAHAHNYTGNGFVSSGGPGGSGSSSYGAFGTTTSSNGGSANLPAGTRLRKFVKYN